jgi:type VI protein secretion system component VasF
VTDQTTAPSAENVPEAAARRRSAPLGRTFVWLGIAGASAALTFMILRATMRPQQAGDETTERIQALIDEANRLIKTLDEKKQP